MYSYLIQKLTVDCRQHFKHFKNTLKFLCLDNTSEYFKTSCQYDFFPNKQSEMKSSFKIVLPLDLPQTFLQYIK